MESYPLDMQGLPVSPYRRADGETVVVLYADMAYYTSKGCIVVPKGFESDGCSMPRFFWRVFGHPFDMQYLREAILHDWLYKISAVCQRYSQDADTGGLPVYSRPRFGQGIQGKDGKCQGFE